MLKAAPIALVLALGAATVQPIALGAARLFEPNVVSGPENDFAPSFSPSGDRLLFTRGLDGRSFILESRRTRGGWSKPAVAAFSGEWIDLEGAWSPDGTYVVFASNRPRKGERAPLTARYYGHDQTGGALWRVDFRRGGWGEPRRLAQAINAGGSVWTPSVATGDELYFMATDPTTGRFRLHAARGASGSHPTVRDLAFSIGAANDVDPYVTPNQDLLIFSSDRGGAVAGDKPGPERLFIALRPRSAHPLVCPLRVRGWEDASISMVEAHLSRDRRTLFFASRHPAHADGAAPQGAWDDGKSNIWTTSFTPALWRFLGASARCRTARIR